MMNLVTPSTSNTKNVLKNLSKTIPKEILEFDQLCNDYINAIYAGASGFISYQPGEKESYEGKKVYLTYGEILYPSVTKIIDYIGDISSKDVFYDLGSGIGKVPLQFFLKTPVKKACGIEASETRNNVAEAVYQKIRQDLPELFEIDGGSNREDNYSLDRGDNVNNIDRGNSVDNGDKGEARIDNSAISDIRGNSEKNKSIGGLRELSCIQTNFLDANIEDATIIYTCSTCFSEELLTEVAKLIDRCPNIRYVISMKQLSIKMPLDRTLSIECTWDKTKCYVYRWLKEDEVKEKAQ